jgi:hypothetical protein
VQKKDTYPPVALVALSLLGPEVGNGFSENSQTAQHPLVCHEGCRLLLGERPSSQCKPATTQLSAKLTLHRSRSAQCTPEFP